MQSKKIEPKSFASVLQSKNVAEVVPDVSTTERDISRSPSISNETTSSIISGDESGRSRTRSARSIDHPFVLGQLVSCRNSENDVWKMGFVSCVEPLYVQFAPNGKHEVYKYICAATTKTLVSLEATRIISQPQKVFTGLATQWLAAKTPVLCVEICNGFAHIISPTEGWVTVESLSPITNLSQVLPIPNQRH